jgi:hypothetical protein
LYGAGFSFDDNRFKRMANINTACCCNIKDPVQFTTHCAYIADDSDDKLNLLSEAVVTAWFSKQNRSVFAVGQEFAFYAGYNSQKVQS